MPIFYSLSASGGFGKTGVWGGGWYAVRLSNPQQRDTGGDTGVNMAGIPSPLLSSSLVSSPLLPVWHLEVTYCAFTC